MDNAYEQFLHCGKLCRQQWSSSRQPCLAFSPSTLYSAILEAAGHRLSSSLAKEGACSGILDCKVAAGFWQQVCGHDLLRWSCSRGADSSEGYSFFSLRLTRAAELLLAVELNSRRLGNKCQCTLHSLQGRPLVLPTTHGARVTLKIF